jgi:hypothetical protein
VADDRIRIEVGFDGGQIMSALVSPDGADSLERALAGNGETSLALDAQDGRYLLRLDRIVYVKRFARDSRVGFAA